MTESSTNGNGPALWAKIVGVVGVPTLILLIVLRLFATDLQAAKNAAAAARQAVLDNNTLMSQHLSQSTRIADLLERVCRRVSKTDYEREACDD